MLTITTGQIRNAAEIAATPGHHFFDVTVKSGDKRFAPTWDMVFAYKRHQIDWAEYTRQYEERMQESRVLHGGRWVEVVKSFDGSTLILCCYCAPPPMANCHRHLLAPMLADYARGLGIEARIESERVVW